jgi:hypothetical protein
MLLGVFGVLNAWVRPSQTEGLNSEVRRRSSPDLKCRRLGCWWNLFSPATRKDPIVDHSRNNPKSPIKTERIPDPAQRPAMTLDAKV